MSGFNNTTLFFIFKNNNNLGWKYTNFKNISFYKIELSKSTQCTDHSTQKKILKPNQMFSLLGSLFMSFFSPMLFYNSVSQVECLDNCQKVSSLVRLHKKKQLFTEFVFLCETRYLIFSLTWRWGRPDDEDVGELRRNVWI